jgi:malonyl-CoA O-methyltransferase
MQTDSIQLNKKHIRRHFDRHAFEYERYAQVQYEMAAHLMDMLERQFPQKQLIRILEIGCGTGILTAQLHRKWNFAHITVVDISEAMIAQTKLKLGGLSDNIQYIVGDVEALVSTNLLGAEYDLIVSNAVFQWFQLPSLTVRGLLSKLHSSGGVFAFSTFGPRTFHELHASFTAAERLLSIDPVPHGQAFLPGNFWRTLFSDFVENPYAFRWEQMDRTLLHPTVGDFLTSIKRIGAGNATQASGSLPHMRQLFKHMEAYYLEHYSVEGSIQATYDLGFGVINLETSKPIQ